jgi:hypothetical protein
MFPFYIFGYYSLNPEREVRSPKDFGEFGDLTKFGCISWDTLYWIKSMPLPSGLVNIIITP